VSAYAPWMAERDHLIAMKKSREAVSETNCCQSSLTTGRNRLHHLECGMKPSTVRVMDTTDEDSAVAIIALAFAADPMARWTWPHAGQYLEAIPRMARAFAGKAFSTGSAFCTESYVGTALWLPPGVHSDEEQLSRVIESTVAPSLALEAAPIFEQMATYHPAEPHWYLPLIGVDPANQGKGYGDALMAHALAQCDRDPAPAYLESSNPRNIPFYQRHGFEPLGAIQVGSSPTLVPMLRLPR
jgi:GNAT superfamily N-acetyltransferase